MHIFLNFINHNCLIDLPLGGRIHMVHQGGGAPYEPFESLFGLTQLGELFSQVQ